MTFTGFNKEDFDVFKIDGLEMRMEELIKQVRPKLEELGGYFAPMLSALTGEEMHAHVAKHARRSVNPPDDTWVAFASSKRGYKMLPHFQVGLWETHVFIWFAMIYEAPGKEQFGKAAEKNAARIIKEIPGSYVWSADHTKPDSIPQSELGKNGLKELAVRLQTVKKAELLCGVSIPREEALRLSGSEMASRIEDTFKTLMPLYELAKKTPVSSS
ncbi:DUF1054 family protein [Bacillus mangrovi]|uniref:UPF0637 protein GKZ89_04075 n=1 Tax=Metabacillus mangrovi TaxID=1491830 RepID=A0A7X2V3Y5_9BACI|nr:DUF1054 domain-containing protein [Metabacillus mangrovi]MTH52574.1 DUF1054 family protein [Metabacillus mangrovi]